MIGAFIETLLPGPRSLDPLSSWHYIMEEFALSSCDFYAQVERALEVRQIPRAAITSRQWPEEGMFSGKRIYLRVRRARIVVDICGAPFGTAYFFSYWMVWEPPLLTRLLLAVPFINLLVRKRLMRPPTYYEADTIKVFHHQIHAAVTETVDAVTKAKGLKALTEEQKKPVMRELFGR